MEVVWSCFMIQVVLWSWVSWWWMSISEKSSWQKLLMVVLLLALHVVVCLAVWTSCCKQEALILFFFGQESCNDDVCICFVPSYPMESALFLVSIVCRDSLFKGCQHCSPKAWSPKAAVQRLTHDGLGSTRICCQVFGGECMCHWCSPLTEKRPLLLDPWRRMCWPIFRERQKGWPVSSCSLRWWEYFHVCFWKSQRLWSVIILHCLQHQMRGRFYTTLPFLFVVCQQNLPLLWGVEWRIMGKGWNIPQRFLLAVQLLPSKSFTPFSWRVDVLQHLRRGSLSLGTSSDNEHI